MNIQYPTRNVQCPTRETTPPFGHPSAGGELAAKFPSCGGVASRRDDGVVSLPPQAGWFVGPEGDFTPSELQALLDAGAIPVSLGQNILRAETACLYGLCVLNCFWL